MPRKNVVIIAGGNGSRTLLTGLKKYPVNLTAIISMADDGGSTGKLREELGVLPPGDVRQCLVALADSSESMKKLLQYRFPKGSLAGHNFGNLFLTALGGIKGDFANGIKEAEKLLKTKGKVLPVSLNPMNLFLELKNGQKIEGEYAIGQNTKIEKVGLKKIYLKPQIKANPEVLQAIKKADLIVIGPGNIYASVMPNFLVTGVTKAIKSSKAKVVYVCNLLNRKGQTEKFMLDDYVSLVDKYVVKNRIEAVVFNTGQPEGDSKEEKLSVKIDERRSKKRNYRIIKKDILDREKVIFDKNDVIAHVRSPFRHDSRKLAKILVDILNEKA